jgi:proline dehydrogenase
VSVKLSGLGLKLDYELCRENLESVVEHAAEHGNFVRIDMEDSSTTDDTLRLYRSCASPATRTSALSCRRA